MNRKTIIRGLAVLSFLILLSLGVWLFNPLATLISVKKLDEYPFYSLRYYGDAAQNIRKIEQLQGFLRRLDLSSAGLSPDFACSLFFSAANSEDMQYGRNFDWQFSPAVVVTYQHPAGNRSIAISNLQWMGFSVQDAIHLDQLPLLERIPLLSSPYTITDGMNDAGVVVGMAAVPDRGMLFDPLKETVSSLEAMRIILNEADTSAEGLEIIQKYNVNMDGGPVIHYLIADAQGDSVLVEITREGIFSLHQQGRYQTATNHYLIAPPDQQITCNRLDTLNSSLQQESGALSPGQAMQLLQQVSQSSTQWSVIDLDYEHPLNLSLKMR